MRHDDASYPHPVAGLHDDVSGELTYDADVRATSRDVTIALSNLHATNATIAALLRTSHASFTVVVTCPATYYREGVDFYESEHEISIPAGSLLGRVQVDVAVCARTAIDNYRPEGLHADYGATVFRVEEGDGLAIAEPMTFDVEKEFDPLKAPVSSFMRIKRGDFPEGPYRVRYDLERILIEMSHRDWDSYSYLRNHTPQVLHSSVVLPVLAEAVSRVRTDADTRELNWGARVCAMLDAQGIADDEPLVVSAQKLLQEPFPRSAAEVVNIVRNADEQ